MPVLNQESINIEQQAHRNALSKTKRELALFKEDIRTKKVNKKVENTEESQTKISW